MRVPLVFCIIFSFFFSTISIAQNGTIRGVVFDDTNGETLPGVTIIAEGTTTGTITDLDGKFNLVIKPGTYTIKISYISYEPITLTGVEVKPSEVTVLAEMGLKEVTFEIKAATVTATRVRNTETALTAIKRKSPNVMDGISAAKLRKTGDSDAASAMKRVTGVSVSGGKYVFVRGLGDRYTKTTLNGVDIPGLDPDRNTLQMDIFPTNVIDNLIVNKSFSADLPADFTGGLIDIGIKDFPDTRIGSISLGAEYNPNFHFNSDFVTYDGGSTDWLGFDDGTRENPISDPSLVNPNYRIENQNPALSLQYDQALRSFSSTMAAKKEQSLMNASLGFSLGNQFVKEKVTLGYNLALSYKSETEFYEDALDSKYILNNDVSINELTNSNYQEGPLGISNTFLGGLGGFAIKTQKAKFRLNVLHLQNGQSTAGIFFKSKDNEGSGFAEGLQHNLEYNQRQLTNLFIDGKHVYTETGWAFEWKLSPTLSSLSDPDIRMTQYKIEDGEYEIDGGENDKPARIWRELTEITATGLFHITKDFNLFGRKSKLKFGGLYTYKEREFLIETFKFNIRGIDFTGNPDELFFEENLWAFGDGSLDGVNAEQNFYPINPNDFNANASNIAGYVKTELSPLENLKTTFGLRIEQFTQYYTGETSEIQLDNEKVLDDLDFFPEVNIIYNITDKMNLRGSFSQTIARPSFKELSYAQIEDPISGVTFNGGFYPNTDSEWDGNLTSTIIQNYDLRWEMYFEGGQMVSLSGFYKYFEDPIEIVMYSGSSAINVQPRNVGNGTVLGLETEFRVNLGSFVEALSPVSLSSNVTLLTSEIDRDKAEYEQKVNNARDGETIEKTRIMAGMSPYIVNAGLSYLGEKGFFEGLEAGLYYNVQGESLEINGVDDRPDVYSVPFHSLNFTSSKSFGIDKQYSLGFRVKNIFNNKKEMKFHSYGSEDFIYQRRATGRSFSLSFKYNF